MWPVFSWFALRNLELSWCFWFMSCVNSILHFYEYVLNKYQAVCIQKGATVSVKFAFLVASVIGIS